MEHAITDTTDTTASKGVACKVGLGNIRHLDTGLLWILHNVYRKNIQVVKVMELENKADVGMKDVSADVLSS